MTTFENQNADAADVPVIDIRHLVSWDVGSCTPGEGARAAAAELDAACRRSGFFYVVGHGVGADLFDRLEAQSRAFFALGREAKMAMRMALGGRAWRGYFPVGEELTSGRPDLKEGLYFGAELSPDDGRVRAGWPLHGPNLFPASMPDFRVTVLEYLDAMVDLGHRLMAGLAMGLGLEHDHFRRRFMTDPLALFRIFHYPPPPTASPLLEAGEEPWGVGEHTDYGVLTILKQDEVGGLEVRSRGRWVKAPPVPGALVCNLGDMLERMTGGVYRSTPHRVRNTSGRGRLSFPFFFDPDWTARIEPVVAPRRRGGAGEGEGRWDGQDVHTFEGTYGDYVLAKVARVFPQLLDDAITGFESDAET